MEDIGQKLKAAREEKHLSIADVEEKTKIQRRYLEAIENNNFDALPGDFYVRAFIKQYAGMVGLDGNELLNDYHQEVPQTQSEEYVENSIDNKSEEVKKTINNRQGMWRNYVPRILGVLAVIAVIVVIYLVYTNVFASNSATKPKTDDVTVTSKSISSSKKSVSKSKSSSEKAAAADKLTITQTGNYIYTVSGLTKAAVVTFTSAGQQVWLGATEDGNIMYQANVNPGETQTLNLQANTQNLQLNVGNTYDLTITIDGKKVELPEATNPANAVTISFNFTYDQGVSEQ